MIDEITKETIIELSNGIQVKVKLINLAGGFVDYCRINDPVYNGDCMIPIILSEKALALVKEEIKVALEGELVKEVI